MPDPNADSSAPDNGTDQGGSVDVTARLASHTNRTAGTSIWQRREAAPPTPPSTPAEPTSAGVPAGTPAPSATAAPASPTSSGVGRLTRVSAADLWTDATAMAGWIAANPDAVADLIGVPGLRFTTSDSGIVLGTSTDGAAACAICEVGPSTDERLGVLLRIAAVQDGGTVLWLNGGPGDAHIAALSWLNRSTAPRFFLAKAAGVRIDGSASAPLFDLVVRPPRRADAARSADSRETVERTADGPQRRVEDHIPEE